MAITLDIRADIKGVTKHLNRIQRKQIPFAASVAINTTLKDVQRAEQKQMKTKLDRPTPQTIKALRVKFSNKRNLQGEVFLLDWAAAYLKYQIQGGTRRTKGGTTAVPTKNARLNKYGNIPGRRKGLVKRKTEFIATIKGQAGVWRRTGRGRKQVQLIHAFIKNPSYPAGRWPFYRIAKGVVDNKFKRNFHKALSQALRTAR